MALPAPSLSGIRNVMSLTALRFVRCARRGRPLNSWPGRGGRRRGGVAQARRAREAGGLRDRGAARAWE
eukprot:CAMPEP_0113676448 /NCGR_PEP_ID=MMETSP0038_2-20120614/8649_1 /TAXON_ID=2898 /ORGANISM="Cryptomonas paramecium" /LENGTH=68 /DNA_ID=CAMNT_0000593479 /DNA_START=301 /DNA_END=507 /DNA_ORIENTATION=+ /assembly_acc=CAM_ASM_000170